MKSFHAGDYVSQGWYNSYSPNPINRNWVVDNVPDKALCVQGEGRRNKTSTGLATGGGDIISV